jgi:hypothetical protein
MAGRLTWPYPKDTPPRKLSRLLNDDAWARVVNFPEIKAAYPYAAVDSKFDYQTKPICLALDWRISKTVFSVEDPIWAKMRPHHCRSCWCSMKFFSGADLEEFKLTLGRGEDWYGKEIEIQVPWAGAVKVLVLPDREIRPPKNPG